jgi:hypothetical protein
MNGRLSLSIAAASLAFAGGAVLAKESHHDFNRLLKGDYAFSGEATCLVSLTGFNADLTPAGPPAPFPFLTSFSIEGVRTFNGDGTGTLSGRVVSLRHPSAIPSATLAPYTPLFNRGGASASDISATFTYTVAPDRTFTIETLTLQGDNVAGTAPGPTFTVANFPTAVGLIGRDHESLTLAHTLPTVETQTFYDASNAPVQTQYRICHRSRILLEMKGGGRHRD